MGQEAGKPAWPKPAGGYQTITGRRYGRRHAYVSFRPSLTNLERNSSQHYGECEGLELDDVQKENSLCSTPLAHALADVPLSATIGSEGPLVQAELSQALKTDTTSCSPGPYSLGDNSVVSSNVSSDGILDNCTEYTSAEHNSMNGQNGIAFVNIDSYEPDSSDGEDEGGQPNLSLAKEEAGIFQETLESVLSELEKEVDSFSDLQSHLSKFTYKASSNSFEDLRSVPFKRHSSTESDTTHQTKTLLKTPSEDDLLIKNNFSTICDLEQQKNATDPTIRTPVGIYNDLSINHGKVDQGNSSELVVRPKVRKQNSVNHLEKKQSFTNDEDEKSSARRRSENVDVQQCSTERVLKHSKEKINSSMFFDPRDYEGAQKKTKSELRKQNITLQDSKSKVDDNAFWDEFEDSGKNLSSSNRDEDSCLFGLFSPLGCAGSSSRGTPATDACSAAAILFFRREMAAEQRDGGFSSEDTEPRIGIAGVGAMKEAVGSTAPDPATAAAAAAEQGQRSKATRAAKQPRRPPKPADTAATGEGQDPGTGHRGRDSEGPSAGQRSTAERLEEGNVEAIQGQFNLPPDFVRLMQSTVQAEIAKVCQQLLSPGSRTSVSRSRSSYPDSRASRRSYSHRRSPQASGSRPRWPTKAAQKRPHCTQQRSHSSEEEMDAREREEGDLEFITDEEEIEPIQVPQQTERFFNMEDFQFLLNKSISILDLKQSVSEEPPCKQARKFYGPKGSGEFFPKPETNLKNFPMPESFERKIRAEWEKPLVTKQFPSFIRKMYALPEYAESFLQVPVIDGPVAALQTSGLVSEDGEGYLKDVMDRKAESALHKAHEAMAMCIRAATTASVVARASMAWCKKLLSLIPDTEGRLQEGTNRILKASAYNADASLDIVVFAARAMASASVARRLLWLKAWQADPHSKTTVVAYPFQGDKLIGDSLDRILIETRDKKKAFPRRIRRDSKPFPSAFQNQGSGPRYRPEGRRGSWGQSRQSSCRGGFNARFSRFRNRADRSEGDNKSSQA